MFSWIYRCHFFKHIGVWYFEIYACELTLMTAVRSTVETLYSTIYYSKYFIELNFDKSTQYVALWTHKRHPIPRPFGRAMECLFCAWTEIDRVIKGFYCTSNGYVLSVVLQMSMYWLRVILIVLWTKITYTIHMNCIKHDVTDTCGA